MRKRAWIQGALSESNEGFIYLKLKYPENPIDITKSGAQSTHV